MNPLITQILEAALLAPSADNTQPWKIRVVGESIDVFHVPERDITPYDTVHRGSAVAHGAFIENAAIAAAELGRSLEVELDDARASNNWHVARLSVQDKKSGDSFARVLYPHIKHRVTNRRPYETHTLPDQQKTALMRMAQTGWGKIEILDYPQPTLAHSISLTEQIAFQNKEIHKNLFKNIRWTDEDVERTRDGFSIRTFELPIPAKIVFRVARSWVRLSFFNAVLGLARTIPDQTSKLYEQSGAFIGLLGMAHSSRDFVKVGRLMQRVWLAGTSLGLSLHPVGAVLFFKKGIDSNTTDAFSDADKELVHKAHKGIFDSFAPQSGNDVLFVFRAGIAKAPPSASTVRLRLADILIQ